MSRPERSSFRWVIIALLFAANGMASGALGAPAAAHRSDGLTSNQFEDLFDAHLAGVIWRALRHAL